MVSSLAFHVGDLGSISPLDQQIFNFHFSPSHTFRVTKPSSFKLATSRIPHPSDNQRENHKSYKGASIKAYLLLQGLTKDIKKSNKVFMDTNFEICKEQWKELSVDAKHVLWPHMSTRTCEFLHKKLDSLYLHNTIKS